MNLIYFFISQLFIKSIIGKEQALFRRQFGEQFIDLTVSPSFFSKSL